MQNFENKLIKILKRPLNNIRGIFEKNKIESKLKDIEKTLLNKNFWKDQKKVKKQ